MTKILSVQQKAEEIGRRVFKDNEPLISQPSQQVNSPYVFKAHFNSFQFALGFQGSFQLALSFQDPFQLALSFQDPFQLALSFQGQ